MVIACIMFSLHYLFLLGTCIAIYYVYSGYELCTYAYMRVYLHGAMRVQGTDSFENVIPTNIFEGVFGMETLEDVHV